MNEFDESLFISSSFSINFIQTKCWPLPLIHLFEVIGGHHGDDLESRYRARFRLRARESASSCSAFLDLFGELASDARSSDSSADQNLREHVIVRAVRRHRSSRETARLERDFTGWWPEPLLGFRSTRWAIQCLRDIMCCAVRPSSFVDSCRTDPDIPEHLLDFARRDCSSISQDIRSLILRSISSIVCPRKWANSVQSYVCPSVRRATASRQRPPASR